MSGVTYTDVIRETCRLFNVHERDLLGPTKYDFLIPARFALCKALVDRGNSQCQVAGWVRRNRTSVRHALRRAAYMVERDPDYRAKVKTLTELGARQ